MRLMSVFCLFLSGRFPEHELQAESRDMEEKPETAGECLYTILQYYCYYHTQTRTGELYSGRASTNVLQLHPKSTCKHTCRAQTPKCFAQTWRCLRWSVLCRKYLLSHRDLHGWRSLMGVGQMLRWATSAHPSVSVSVGWRRAAVEHALTLSKVKN